jgi:hypothetical protein
LHALIIRDHAGQHWHVPDGKKTIFLHGYSRLLEQETIRYAEEPSPE